MSRLRWCLVLLPWVTVALGARLSFQEHAAVQESLSRVHPRMRAGWLKERGLDDSYYTTFHRPESTGLRCIGRWPWGPSWELAGRDTFLYLGSGSGVRILSIADSVHPRMLGQINARGLVSQVVVQDSLLFVACGSWGAQIYSVTDPADPRELGSMDAVISDVCVKDTFCYAVGSDGLRIYNVASASEPRLVGAVQDSGDLVVVANGHAFSAGRSVMNIYNVTDPVHPTWVNSRGGPCYAMALRRNLIFCSSVQPDNMTVLNISNPLSVTQVSQVAGYGGEGLYVDDSYAYMSCTYGHHGLFVVDMSDSSRPVMRDSIDPEGVEELEPYVPSPNSYGYLADHYGGLVTVDLHDVSDLSLAWEGYKADRSVDIAVDNGRAYIADHWVGAQIVDVSNPTRPVSLSVYDTSDSRGTNTATARDSFAFVGYSGPPSLRVLNITDPRSPTLVAEESCYNWPMDCVLRDSLLYTVEDYRFEVFNVARPREPALVGSCDLPYYSSGMCLVDSLAYVANYPFAIINVRQPSNPVVIGSISRGAWNGAVRDTLLFLSSGGILAYSVASPSQPRLLDSLSVGSNTFWVEAVGTLLYTANRDGIHVIDAADVHDMRVRGFCSAPYEVDRLTFKSPYLYAACWNAGMCVYESTQVAVSELKKGGDLQSALSVRPNPAKANVVLSTLRHPLETITVRDVAGRVMPFAISRRANGDLALNLATAPSGVYFVEGRTGASTAKVKFVRQ